jgi:hypothetical protein
MEEIDGIPVDLTLLPNELSDLAPLIRKFAVSAKPRWGRTGRRELEALASHSDPRPALLSMSSKSQWAGWQPGPGVRTQFGFLVGVNTSPVLGLDDDGGAVFLR